MGPLREPDGLPRISSPSPRNLVAGSAALPPSPRRGRRRRLPPDVVAVIGLFVVALNLRPAITSIPPLIETIRVDLGLSAAAAGLLTAIPVLLMGVLAPPAARLGARYGIEPMVLGAIALLGGATLARTGGSSVVALFASAFGAGAGIAVVGTLLVGFVKQRFAARAGAVTGVYSVGIQVGAVAGAGLTVPVEQLTGSWPVALAAWSILAVMAMVMWAPVRRRGATQAAPVPVGLPWKDRVAWTLSAFFAGESVIYYSALTWLPALYQEHGVGRAGAGVLLAAMTGAQVVGALAIPMLADRSLDRRPWLFIAATLMATGLVGVTFAPMAIPAVWMVFFGVGIGGVFALTLILPVDLATDVHGASRIAAMAFVVGYPIAALGPFLTGALHDISDGYRMPFVVLTMIAVPVVVATVALRPRAADSSVG